MKCNTVVFHFPSTRKMAAIMHHLLFAWKAIKPMNLIVIYFVKTGANVTSWPWAYRCSYLQYAFLLLNATNSSTLTL